VFDPVVGDLLWASLMNDNTRGQSTVTIHRPRMLVRVLYPPIIVIIIIGRIRRMRMRMTLLIMKTILMNKLLLITTMTELIMLTATITFDNGVHDGVNDGTNHQDRISMATPTSQQQQQQKQQQQQQQNLVRHQRCHLYRLYHFYHYYHHKMMK